MGLAITTLVDRQNRFSELLEAHQGIIAKVVATYCWHADDRDELSQEIMTQLWRSYSKFDESQQFSTWMYRVALNVSISWVRRNTVRKRYTGDADRDIQDWPDRQDDREVDERFDFLRTFVEQLDPLNRALMLLYFEERSYAEMSVILGITETNVATKISRLKQRVRKQYAAIVNQGASDGTR